MACWNNLGVTTGQNSCHRFGDNLGTFRLALTPEVQDLLAGRRGEAVNSEVIRVTFGLWLTAPISSVDRVTDSFLAPHQAEQQSPLIHVDGSVANQLHHLDNWLSVQSI